LHDFHIFRNVGENGRLNEVADIAVALAAGLDLGAGFLPLVDIATCMSALQKSSEYQMGDITS